MQTQRDVRTVPADLQDVGGRHREHRTAAVVEVVRVRDQRAQRVVAATKIEDHQVAGTRALSPGEIREERRCRERHGERPDTAFDELTSGDLHMNWYSAVDATRCTRPATF